MGVPRQGGSGKSSMEAFLSRQQGFMDTYRRNRQQRLDQREAIAAAQSAAALTAARSTLTPNPRRSASASALGSASPRRQRSSPRPALSPRAASHRPADSLTTLSPRPPAGPKHGPAVAEAGGGGGGGGGGDSVDEQWARTRGRL